MAVQIITLKDKRYPLKLKEIARPPQRLYIKGEFSNFKFNQDYFISIVGTRRPTSYGLHVVRKLVSELAASGFVIVSGMAIGIDAAVHRAALEVSGRTIAVLAGNVEDPQPRSNSPLYQDIINSGGLIISEFPAGIAINKGLFIARNRIVSGLSHGVLVIEGSRKSGSLTTARFAAEQGREVFAVPGPITSEMSAAPNILLKEGAHLVTSVQDILDEFNLKLAPAKKEKLMHDLSADEVKIIESLSGEPKFIDELILELKLTVNAALNTLSILEVKGVVEKNQEGRYQLRL